MQEIKVYTVSFFLLLHTLGGILQAQQGPIKSAMLVPVDGMTFSEVIERWGPPLEKQEFEAKREELWIYGEQRVRFYNGRVLPSVVSADAKSQLTSTLPEIKKADPAEVKFREILIGLSAGSAEPPLPASPKPPDAVKKSIPLSEPVKQLTEMRERLLADGLPAEVLAELETKRAEGQQQRSAKKAERVAQAGPGLALQRGSARIGELESP